MSDLLILGHFCDLLFLVATVWSWANLDPKQKGPVKSDPNHLHPFDDGNDDAFRSQLLTS
ncbi:hypothetical protein [Synechococcus sp. MIT S9508]|uniref:hypothetical protein n=1 Tax=Synechococcus sp. MIT S9508 TaxID=1801629 RepID=UPI00082DAB60|nr:hypothetical protein [Synechococcus sp. MIT S9508]